MAAKRTLPRRNKKWYGENPSISELQQRLWNVRQYIDDGNIKKAGKAIGGVAITLQQLTELIKKQLSVAQKSLINLRQLMYPLRDRLGNQELNKIYDELEMADRVLSDEMRDLLMTKREYIEAHAKGIEDDDDEDDDDD